MLVSSHFMNEGIRPQVNGTERMFWIDTIIYFQDISYKDFMQEGYKLTHNIIASQPKCLSIFTKVK